MDIDKKIKSYKEQLIEIEKNWSPKESTEFNKEYNELLSKIEELKIKKDGITVSGLKRDLIELEKKGLGDKPILSLCGANVLIVVADNHKGDGVWYYAEDKDDL